MAFDIPAVLEPILKTPTVSALAWLLFCAGLFGALQHLFAHDRSQPAVRKDAWIDGLYWLAGPAVYGPLAGALMMGGLALIFAGDMEAAWDWASTGAPWASDIPLPVQALMILMVTDLVMYWVHRLFHTRALWRFHAIHHSAVDMDWLHAVRFHPVNYVPQALVPGALVVWLGFSPAAMAMLVPFNILYSAMVHANLNWTFGPFRYLLVSPVYHRWHHTGPDEGGGKNFAPTFPVLDLIFGTYFMPTDRLPGKTGLVEADMPATLSGQLLYPWTGRPGTPELTHPSAS